MRETSSGRLLVEIQSVNRKHLEISLQLPPSFARFEGEIRKQIAEKMQRGHVTVRVQKVLASESVQELLPSVELLLLLKERWQKIAIALGESAETIDLPFLMLHVPEELRSRSEEEPDGEELHEVVAVALSHWMQMRQEEGGALLVDVEERLIRLQEQIHIVAQEIPGALDVAREQWRKKLLELFAPGAVVEERILKEVALCAERVDISEELVRLDSHLQQFTRSMRAGMKVTSGKKLEFVLQEMGREVNTMGAKSAALVIIRATLEMKGELEKIREQLQNIE